MAVVEGEGEKEEGEGEEEEVMERRGGREGGGRDKDKQRREL